MKLPQYCTVDRVDNPIQGELAAPIISMCATIAPPADLEQKQISVVGFSQLFFFLSFQNCSKCTAFPASWAGLQKKIKYRVT